MYEALTESELHVNSGSGALEDTESSHNWRWHAISRLVDVEVGEGTLSLSSPVLVGWDMDLAEGIGLCSGLGHLVCRCGEVSAGDEAWRDSSRCEGGRMLCGLRGQVGEGAGGV